MTCCCYASFVHNVVDGVVVVYLWYGKIQSSCQFRAITGAWVAESVSLEWWSIVRVYERPMWIRSNLFSALSTAGTEKSQYHASVEFCHCCEFQQVTCTAERWIGDVSELMKEPLTNVMISCHCSSGMDDDGFSILNRLKTAISNQWKLTTKFITIQWTSDQN